jgi:hypothetical protein
MDYDDLWVMMFGIDMPFQISGDLFKHLQKNHVGDALYTCEHCSATFRLKIQLRDHYKVHYQNEPDFC